MNNLFTIFFYIITVFLLTLSFIKSKAKTILSLKRALKMLFNVFPQFLAILLLMGLLLAFVDAQTIQNIIGTKSGIFGMLLASLLGSISLVPVLIAFPIASRLLENGAGIIQITVFICTLTSVGIVTLPLESKYLGKKIAILRNTLFYISAFVIALIMGVVLS
ncbi:permease [Clostridium hydrogenum]|uniref:permease n=1 Tax=Clostridium hydrogenum TaxID=2855764 RepID=UPI001F46530E|nr:permease [Clostridium hydrogenum]